MNVARHIAAVKGLTEEVLGFMARLYGIRPGLVLCFDGGVGDDLLCSAVLTEAKERGIEGRWIVSRHAELFRGNPAVDRVLPARGFVTGALERGGIPVIRPRYMTHAEVDVGDRAPPRHIIAEMCRLCGIRGEVRLRPYMYLSDAERKWARRWDGFVAIQTSGLSARFPYRNKEWFPEQFQRVGAKLQRDYRLVQLGSRDDPGVAGAVDLRGKLTVRESAAVLSGVRVFVGLVGMLMHLNRAVDGRAVIVYGGREDPAISGYSCNENLFVRMECAPCWRRNSCPYDRECMRRVDPNDVLAAVDRQVRRSGERVLDEMTFA